LPDDVQTGGTIRHTGSAQDHSSVQHYLGVLRRRKWIVLQAVLIATLAAVVVSLQQEHLYRASSEVLLQKTSPISAATGVLDPNAYTSDDRFAQTQAELARVPEVTTRAVRASGVRVRTAADLLVSSSVTPHPNANILEFNVTDEVPAYAQRLATAYGRVFTEFQREIAVETLRQARLDVEAQLRQLRALGETKSELYIGLVTNAQRLRQIELLQGKHRLVRSASRGTQVQPRPLRNGILGFVLGLGLGTMLAFLREALDTRVRTAGEISERLGLPLLARLPEPPTRFHDEHRLVMLEEPVGLQAEAFRVLRTNLEFANLERGARVIMVTSALEAEGKTTTVANLAVALARAGKRVIAVDLDLRRPMLDKLFRVDRQRPGLTQVALGLTELDGALVPIPISDPGSTSPSRESRFKRSSEGKNGDPQIAGNAWGLSTNDAGWDTELPEWSNGSDVRGVLELLPAGPLPPDVGEFVGSRSLSTILEQLRERADIVLVDSPPLLRVGDTITLSGKVDGMLVAANLNQVRRPVLNELRRVLDTCPADRLGFVLTGSNLEEGYGYGYGGYYAPAVKSERESVA